MHDKTYCKTCVTSKDSDQPADLCSLIRVFADHLCRLQPLGYPNRHYENMPIQNILKILPQKKMKIFRKKNSDMFHFSAKNIDCGYSLELPRPGGSNEYPQSMPKVPASVAQLDAPSDWRPGGRGFNPRRGRQHSFVEIDHEIFSTVILSLPLIQEGQLSVSGERMCTILVNRLED